MAQLYRIPHNIILKCEKTAKDHKLRWYLYSISTISVPVKWTEKRKWEHLTMYIIIIIHLYSSSFGWKSKILKSWVLRKIIFANFMPIYNLSISVPKFPLWPSHILTKKPISYILEKNNPLSLVRIVHTFMSAHFPTV